MKHLFLLLGLCSGMHAYAQKSAFTLAGRSDADTKLIVAFEPESRLSKATDTIRVSANGFFSKQLELKKTGSAVLLYGGDKRLQLWLSPGDSVWLNLDGTKAPIVTGPGTDYVTYFLSDRDYWKKIYTEYEQKYPGFDDKSSRFSDRYFGIQDSIIIKRMNHLNEFMADAQAAGKLDFLKHQHLSFLYSNLYYKLMFEGSDISKFKFFQDRYKLKKAFAYAFSDKVETDDPKLLDIGYYRDFMTAAASNSAMAGIKRTGQKFEDAAYIDSTLRIIDELSDKPEVSLGLKISFLEGFIYERIKVEKQLSKAALFYLVINSLSQDQQSDELSRLRDKLDRLVPDTRFSPGNPAPAFSLRSVSGKVYTLNGFKGKKLYIDLGASWCGPCIGGIPAWNALVKSTPANGNIAFVSLSMDSKKAEWRAFLKKYKVAGLQLFAGEGGFKSDFAIRYNISQIPHFILIDERGNVISYSAPAPGSEEITRLLK